MTVPLPIRDRAVVLLVSAAMLMIFAGAVPWGRPRAVQATSQAASSLEDPDAVCASCHRAIFERYEKTAMARGSGAAAAALLPGTFHHASSGIDYSIFERDGAAWMSFSRPADTAKGALDGQYQLAYFIGSGERGRTYLYQQGQQWFELPINYYTARARWAMTPAYEAAPRLPGSLPIDPNCLHCHTSLTQPALPTARNAYAATPFLQGGVGCSGCHGDPAAHLALHGRGPIVNPSKLDAPRRDSVCLQCHLEGDAVVYRAGKSLAQFKPGEDLNDFAVYFVHQSRVTGGDRAVSQYEALLRSACKRAVGDKLTCTTCHDPHGDPAPAERVAYFRNRCLSCHRAPEMATHHPEQPDCASCHMPTRSTVDVSHVQVTDHDIEREPGSPGTIATGESGNDLVPVGRSSAGDREFGLAYAQAAVHGFPGAARQSREHLEAAWRSGEHDSDLEVRLAYLEQLAGDSDKARTLYRAALEQDPWEPTALTNLAVMDAGSHHADEAIRLLERLVLYDPSQTTAGLNLAWIDCSVGRSAQARAVLLRLQPLNPDDPQLREFLAHGSYAGGHCDLPPGSPESGRQGTR